MPLVIGSRLGPYEVVAPIGAGGMGEVYRATDTHLKRAVAIKVLPAAVVADADRLARFQREAQVLASLNHPNIAAIYGFGEERLRPHRAEDEQIRGEVSAPARAGGGAPAPLEESGRLSFIVMEFVDGPTLADRIAQGPLGLDDALAVAKQILDALEAAHEQGIVHRDLKPANVKMRPDGTVKVLDFGLAKAIAPDPSRSGTVSMSPTITSPAMTQAGMILGTAAYMAPEQARGRAIDRRADIWAFGVVLFEMLTGKRPFEDEDISMTLSRVLQTEPTFDAIPASVPANIRQVLRLCLRKDPRQRVADVRDVRLALEGAFETVGSVASAPPAKASRWPHPAWIAGAVVLAGLAAVAGTYLGPKPAPALETRLDIMTPPGRLSSSKLSPDGRKVIFAAAAEGKPEQLWVRTLDSEVAQPLAGTENAATPFWSPDSRSIAFHAPGTPGKLMRIDLAGGSARPLTNAANALGGAWAPDGTILFSANATSPLSRVPASGGEPTEVTHLNGPAEVSHRWPDFLPDGRHFLFFAAGTTAVQGVYVGSLDGDTHRLVESQSAPVFVYPDYVLFAREGNLLAQRIDLTTLELKGDPLLVAEQVSVGGIATAEFPVSASRTGMIAYRAPRTEPRRLTWLDDAGRELGTLGETLTDVNGFRISPDGRFVALTRTGRGNGDIWSLDTNRSVLRPLVSDAANDNSPVWAPGSDRFAFMSRRSGPQNLWLKNVATGKEEHLRESPANEVPQDWSRDGKFILFTEAGSNLWALPIDGERKPVPVATATSVEDGGRFSPDSSSVVYQSNETGRNEIYLVPFPGLGVPMPVSTGGGVNARWRADGRAVYYMAPDDRLMVAPVTRSNGNFEVGTPAALFTISAGDGYVVRDDGRILINKLVGERTTPPIVVIQHWQPGSR